MKRRLAAIFAFALAVSACSSSGATVRGVDDRPLLRAQLEGSDGVEGTPVALDNAQQLLDEMSLEQKIGQLFIPVVAGSHPTELSAKERAQNAAVFGLETPAEIVEKYQLGGVMYLAPNVDGAEQVKEFTAELQTIAQRSTVPLLIAIDQEGGRVNRITDGVTVAPSAAELSGDAEAVRSASSTTGTQVKDLGVNVVLAPVADLSKATDPGVIGNRSFGENPEQTAEMVTAAVDGLQESGVAAAVKHWPGHGATNIDSHKSKPSVVVSKPDWEVRERIPFEAAIEEEVEIVLVGHLSFPEFAPDDRVATVSDYLVDDLLRAELGYDRIVMTDALNMGAVEDIAQSELGTLSIEAGIDMLLYPENMESMYQGVLDAIESERISQQRLDESVLRILRLKSSLGLLDDFELPPSEAETGDSPTEPAPEPNGQAAAPPAETIPVAEPTTTLPAAPDPITTTTTVVAEEPEA